MDNEDAISSRPDRKPSPLSTPESSPSQPALNLKPRSRLSGSLSDAQSAQKTPCSHPLLSDPEARALAASIERKMENVLQSMRSRGQMSSGHSSGQSSRPSRSKNALELTFSADDLETFSSAEDEDDVEEEKGIVDSMANFVPDATPRGQVGVFRKERGNLAGTKATKKESDEKGKKQEMEEEACTSPSSPASPSQLVSPKNVAGRLMKKLTGGKKRFAGVFISPKKTHQKEK